MLRWILQDHDHISAFRHYGVNESVVHAQLSQVGFSQPFWFYVTDQAFRAFFNRDYLRPEELRGEQLKTWQTEMQRVALPQEMRTQIRKLLIDEGLSNKKFTVRLSCDLHKGAMPSKLLYDYCEMTAFGVEGIFQAIKSSWISLLNKGFMTAVWNSGLTLADLKVGILIMVQTEAKQEGKVYSVSPKCLWDRRHLVLTMTKLQPAKDYIEALAETGEHAYLVDRESLTVTYYGRDIFGEKTKSRSSAPFDYELIKKVAKQFIQAEKTASHPMIGEWSIATDGQIYFNRWNQYTEAPAATFYQETLNSPARHFWYLLQWNQKSDLCLPFWFSLMVKHFRTASLKMLGQTQAKRHMPAAYEKVLRQSLGILRGRAYINMGALHRLLHLGPYDSMFKEVDKVLASWQKRFDKEHRVSWDAAWPDLPTLKTSDKKTIRSSYKKMLKSVKKNTEKFYLQFESEMEFLYDLKWDQKNLAESFQEIRELEARMVKLFSPALFFEMEYWSMKSYCHKMCANTGDFSWLEDEDSEFIPTEGDNWFSRRRQRLLNEKWEAIKNNRKQVHKNLFKYHDLLKKRLEVLASKFVALGILKKAADLFYLTLDEILSFEEGRLMTINLQKLVEYRVEEYKTYATDEKTPQIWLTIGLVGLAEKYQSVISIKDVKHEWTPVEDLIETELAVTTKENIAVSTVATAVTTETAVTETTVVTASGEAIQAVQAAVAAEIALAPGLNIDSVLTANSASVAFVGRANSEDLANNNTTSNNATNSNVAISNVANSNVTNSNAIISNAELLDLPTEQDFVRNLLKTETPEEDDDIFKESSIRNIQI